MRHRVRLALGVVATVLVQSAPSAAHARLADVRGHLAIGYGRVFSSDTTDTPGGSLSMGAGLDYPIGAGLRAGVDIGYHSLGTVRLDQGSISTELDFSVLEALALVHWFPSAGGRRFVLSGGPGMFSARAILASSPVGAIFSRSAIDQWRAGAAVSASIVRRQPSPVRVGLEAGVRVVPLERFTWTLAMARVVIHY
jgi:hypothetical protein